MAETGKNFCPSKDGVDNLGKSGKAWGKTYTKDLNVSGTADIQALRVSGTADIQALRVSGFTGILPVAHGGTGTDSLANITVGKAGTLDGNAGLWDYLHRLGENPTLPTTNTELNALGVFMSYFDQNNKIANQPTQYGQLINIPAIKDADESTQLWIEQPGGRMFHRGSNGSIAINDTPFKRFLDTDDLSAAGVVAGDVSNVNAWWVKLGGAVPLIIQGGINYNKNSKLTLPITYNNDNYIFTANNVELNAETGGINIIAEREIDKLTLYTYGSNSRTRFNGWMFGNIPLKVAWLTVGW